MKKVGFIGGFNKTDFIIYIAKILVEFRKKVLLIDATLTSRTRYSVHSISPSQFYITEHQGIDVAVGFKALIELEQYLKTKELPYDIVLIDTDTPKRFEAFNLAQADKNYFVTAFDTYSIRRGLETIGKRENKIPMTKILFSKDMLREEEEYLNFLSAHYSVQWDKDKIYFPYDSGDESAIMENQRLSRITFKNLSLQYREGLYQVAQQLLLEEKNSDIKRIVKNI